MEPRLLPTKGSAIPAFIVELNAAPNTIFLQQLLRLWLTNSNRAVRIGGLREHDEQLPIAIALEDGTQTEFVGMIPADDFRKFCPRFAPLPETPHRFADMPGVVADTAWFDSRNKRLGIKDEPGYEAVVAPVKSLAELFVSYAMSSAGEIIARKTLAENSRFQISSVYHITLKFHAEEFTWHEDIYVLEKRLERFLTNRQSTVPQVGELRM